MPKKLAALAVVSVCIAILLTSVGLSWHSVYSMRQAEVAQLTSQANMLAFYTKAVLKYQDPVAAQQLLASLQSQSELRRAALLDAEGRVMASYPQGVKFDPSQVALEPGVPRFLDAGELALTHAVLEDGDRLGTLVLVSGREELRRQQSSFARILGLVTLGSLACSVALALFLQRHITGPLLRLVQAADRIASGDYSVRLDCGHNDELGSLCRGFNRMAEHISSSEAQLLESQSDLEERVALRTYELSEEVARREVFQRALVNAKNAAEAANQAKSAFLANMSHEIRTPLNAILGFTELLRRGQQQLAEPEKEHYLETVESSGRHLLLLINDILDLSKIEAGQLETERIAFAPHQLVAEAVETLRIKAHEKGIALDYFWTTRLPRTIQSDPARLKQLILNLLSNAIKFTASGSVTVVARLDTDQTPPRLALDVVDTGIGIRSDKLHDIFDPFVQADNSVTRKFGGTGLGLAISRRIAQALGGELTVQSVPGVGSTFTATVDPGCLDHVELLDAPPTAEDQLAPITPEPEEEEAEYPQIPDARILLVEDGETNRQLIGIVLGQAGVRVTMAENGAIGVERALAGDYDLILMDMQMPVMDGYTATRRLRELGKELPIVALTAHAMTGDEQKCLEAGCTAYLTKPIDCDRLLATVCRLLETRVSPPAQVPRPAHEKTVTATSRNLDQAGELVSRLACDDAFAEVVEVFRQHCRRKTEEMEIARQAGDLPRVRELAHWLRGSAGTAGFDDFTEPATALELAARDGRASDVAAHCLVVRNLTNRLAPLAVPTVAS